MFKFKEFNGKLLAVKGLSPSEPRSYAFTLLLGMAAQCHFPPAPATRNGTRRMCMGVGGGAGALETFMLTCTS